jgi:hypothetical protein
MWYLVGIAAALGVAYMVECWWWPWTACPRCEGAGKHRRDDGLVWRDCRRCGGSGKRLRVGRRLWLAARRKGGR